MAKEAVGIFELGSNSLKYHRVTVKKSGSRRLTTEKLRWDVAHDFYSRNQFTDEALEGVLATIRAALQTFASEVPPERTLSIATGVFRDIPDRSRLADRMKNELGVRLRVISGADEAKLMAKGMSQRPGSIFIGDVGGATTEWAWVEDGEKRSAESLRLGTIRNLYATPFDTDAPDESVAKSSEYCDRQIAELPPITNATLVATGGTAKALAKVHGDDAIPVDDLRRIIADVARNGAPESLKKKRRQVFLPGIIILERLAVHCGSDAVHYEKSGVGGGVAGRLAGLEKKKEVENIRETMMLQTRSFE